MNINENLGSLVLALATVFGPRNPSDVESSESEGWDALSKLTYSFAMEGLFESFRSAC